VLDVLVAVSASTPDEVVFERGKPGALDGGLDRFGGQRSTAEVGVQNGSGEIEDAALRGTMLFPQGCVPAPVERLRVERLAPRACFGEQPPRNGTRALLAIPGAQCRSCFRCEKALE
jgi:hypothetical protein